MLARNRIPGLLALVALLAVPAAAQAATRVATSSGGSTATDCIAPHTACTLNHAVAVAVAGDEVVLGAGTYPEASTVALDKPLTLRGVDGPRPRITNGGAVLTLLPGADGTVVRHLELSDQNVAGNSNTVIAGAPLTLDDDLILASGPGVNASDVGALTATAPTLLSNSQVIVNKDASNSGHVSVRADTGGKLTLRNVDVTRVDSNIGPAVAAAGAPIDVDGLRVHTGSECVTIRKPSVLQHVDATSSSPIEACLRFFGGSSGSSVRHSSFAEPQQNTSTNGAIFVGDATGQVLMEDVTVTASFVGIFTTTENAVTLRRAAVTAGYVALSTLSLVQMTDSVLRAVGPVADAAVLTSQVADVRSSTLLASGSGTAVAVSDVGTAAHVTLVDVIARGEAFDLSSVQGFLSVASSSYRFDKIEQTSGGTVSVGAGNQDANVAPPLLADPAHGDVHQLPGSPTIDAGVSDPLLGPSDLDGDARILGSAPDIGADEFVPAPRPGPGPSPAPARDTTAPVLSSVSLSHASFASAGRRPTGTSIRYRLSEGATVTIAIARRQSGRRKGGRCVAPTAKTRKLRSCTRYVTVGSLSAAGARGANATAFSGRLRGRALPPGRYRATLTATDAAHNTSKPVSVAFTVKR